jgi:cell division protein FtsL
MIKLLLCLLCSAAIAVVTLELRQQKLELSCQANRLHSQIEQSKAKLWDQQVQIAVYTAPNAIAKTVGDRRLQMVPTSPLPAGKSEWLDVREDSAAE